MVKGGPERSKICCDLVVSYGLGSWGKDGSESRQGSTDCVRLRTLPPGKEPRWKSKGVLAYSKWGKSQVERRGIRTRSFLSYAGAYLYFPLQPELSSSEYQMQNNVCPVEPFLLHLFPWKLLPPGSSGAIPLGGDQSGTREWRFSLSIRRENRITTKLLRFWDKIKTKLQSNVIHFGENERAVCHLSRFPRHAPPCPECFVLSAWPWGTIDWRTRN